MTPSTVNVVCAKASVKVPRVPATRYHLFAGDYVYARGETIYCPATYGEMDVWLCSFCGARVKVVA